MAQLVNLFVQVNRNRNRGFGPIADNAGGISPKNEEKIFTANYSTKDNDKNSGLGLYIAKTLIENKMMGELSVSNDNQGACFCIKMQVVQ